MNNKTIIDFLTTKCIQNAELPLLTCNSNAFVSYSTFLNNILETKEYLATLNVKQGTKFCIALENTPSFLYLLFGGLFCGGIAVNLNPDLSESEFEYRLEDAQVKVLFSTKPVIQRLSKIIVKLGIVAHPVEETLESDICTFCFGSNRTLSPQFDSAHYINNPSITKTSSAFLQYTGGTTGITKAAVIKHENIVESVLQMSQYLSPILQNRCEIFVVTFPFFHVFSIVFQVLTAINFGGRIVMYPKTRNFESLELILEQENFTVFVGVHTLYKMMLNSERLKHKHYPKTKLFLAGAEHIQPFTKEKWLKQTGHLIREGYGLTETTGLATMSDLNNECNDFDSIGVPLPKTEIVLINEKGEMITTPNTPGELCIKGPQVVSEYWNRTTENNLTFKESWLKTGDIAIRKPNNQYKIVDRKKDMIIVSGNNVYSNEVERVLLDYPNIVECAVVGMPDIKSGERVVAFYTSSEDISELKLKLFCDKHLIAYKTPFRFIRLQNIPKSPVGKTLKSQLRIFAKDLK